MFDVFQVTKCLEHIPWHQKVPRKNDLILQFSVALELQLDNFIMFYKYGILPWKILLDLWISSRLNSS